jgi:hypothetical protein
MQQLFHLLKLDVKEQIALKYVLDFHSWHLMSVMVKMLPFTDVKLRSSLISKYYGRVYSSIKIASALVDFEDTKEAKVFRIDRYTFQEIQKGFANFDAKVMSDQDLLEEKDVFLTTYPELKKNVDTAALFCYSFDELKGV